jgi:hypothetical protein
VANRVFQFDQSNPHWRNVQTLLNNHIVSEVSAGRVLRVTVGEPKRSHEQNDRMWAMLTDVSEQLEWPIDGKTQRLSPEEWKDVLTAALKREQRVAMGIDGGFVILGQRTSKMTKRELSDLMELIAAFGAEQRVVFHEKG